MKYYLFSEKANIKRYFSFAVIALLILSFCTICTIFGYNEVGIGGKIVVIFFDILGGICIALIIIEDIKLRARNQFLLIDKNGIEYHKKEKCCLMKWNDLHSVTISGRPQYPYLLIFSKELIAHGNTPSIYEMFKPKNISKDYIFIEYYQEVYDEIKKYYKEEINREYTLAISGKYEI